MRKKDVSIGGKYLAKVSGARVMIQILGESQFGGWDAKNLATGRQIRIKTAGRLTDPNAPRKRPTRARLVLHVDERGSRWFAIKGSGVEARDRCIGESPDMSIDDARLYAAVWAGCLPEEVRFTGAE